MPSPAPISDYVYEPSLKACAVARQLNLALAGRDPNLFLQALSEAARDKGIAKLAMEAGVGRESLYKTLADGAKPRYDTVLNLLHHLGVKVVIEAR